ncbi:MAG: ketoacyl-ACP synthase III [Bdellovibrionales bacterium]
MSVGIEKIVTYIPPHRLQTDPESIGMTADFLDHTVGVRQVSTIGPEENAVSICENLFSQLDAQLQMDFRQHGQLVVVVGQTLDTNMPHTSALVHGRLGLNKDCVCFDVSLGCTGFVHGLSIVKSFMVEHGFSRALLFNVEIMSRIVDRTDRGTSPIFGDGASLTFISDRPRWEMSNFSYGTSGTLAQALKCEDFRLKMDGQVVYEFVSRNVPKAIRQLLAKKEWQSQDVDKFVFHQASRRTVEKVRDFLKLKAEQVPFEIRDYGNLGACSIPVILAPMVEAKDLRRIVICGFGVGLAWAAGILTRPGQ